MEKVHIIAEAGNNHNGNRETGCKLIDIASQSGADSVKFQIIYPEGLYLPRFFKDGAYSENEVFIKRKAAVLSEDDYRFLAEYTRKHKLGFSASIFDQRGLDLLDELNADYIKIASCDLNNSPLLTQVAERKRKMVISTGMSTLGEIERAVTDVARAGNDDIVLMHCVSIYPAPTRKMNLQFLTQLKTAFGFPVGLSDHTEENIVAPIAVALGVQWIEKHFTLNRGQEGFDHAYAMEPENFKEYVNVIRSAEIVCARQEKKVQPEEATTRLRARRSLYAARDLQPGAVLTEQDILIVRPEGPLSPNDLYEVLGKKLNRAVSQYQALSWDQFSS